jgi:hypothetical protein
MAKMFLGPAIVGSAQYSTGSALATYAGLALKSDNTSNAFAETWNPSTSNNTGLNRTTNTGLNYTMFYTNTTAPTANKFLAGGPAGATRLNIYKGARPSISTLTNLNNHSSDLLISFSIPAYSTTTSQSGIIFNLGSYYVAGTTAGTSGLSRNQNNHYDMFRATLGVCPQFTQASAGGRATWFWFGNYSNPSNLSGLAFVTGSVGISGSNSDLEMADTNIDPSGLYKSFGFKFIIPAYHEI